METLTLENGATPPTWIFALLLCVGLGFFLLLNQDRPVDEISEAMTTGILVSTQSENGCNNFRLKDFKSPGKWRKQFRTRGFSVDRVAQILANGSRQMVTDQFGKQMMKITDQTGDYIIVDPKNCEIWQVAPARFLNEY